MCKQGKEIGKLGQFRRIYMPIAAKRAKGGNGG
jgi:hypothetical protein